MRGSSSLSVFKYPLQAHWVEIGLYLTNEEALTVLGSVVKHGGSG